jgi:RNA polymerase subunit RPABC4/transcription elongation factor Spt4
VSLIVIILIDIFILVNVFTGLHDISQWHLDPGQTYPCYPEWSDYQKQTATDKDYAIVQTSLLDHNSPQGSLLKAYQDAEIGHLGKVSPVCLNYADAKDQINRPLNQQIARSIDQKANQIERLEQANRTIRSQYDSTLLEKIAGQSPDQSINTVKAEQAKQKLDQNNAKIADLKQETISLKNQLLAKSESAQFLALLKDGTKFKQVETGFQRSSFWYPSIQLFFQALFLLPLILIALLVHRFALQRGYGLIALISWHLLVIFFVPLTFKIFEFLQINVIFQFIFDIISQLLGGLLFLVSYIYILLVPLVGFGIIKFFQRFVFNSKVQVTNRIQKSQCIRCAKKIRHQDLYCPYCGYHQATECQNCHTLTYQHLPYCRQCGSPQPSNH